MKEEGGKFIDNYEITETIHASAEGIIYKAVEKTSDAKVLIKKYYPALDWSDEILNEFFNLSGYLRYIEHEYLLSVLDIGKDEGKPYIVFADNSVTLLCDRQAGQASQAEILNFFYKTAEALDFLHKQEILHGSLTPENIAIDPNGYPLLFDYGLNGVFKKVLLENMDDGFDNISIASLKCTSPEQILGRTPTRLSDIYTFGIIGYYYIFGESPIDGHYVPETAASYFKHDILRTIQLSETVSENTLELIQKCVQLDPEARFTNFTQIIASLERMKSGKKARLKFDKRFTITKPPTRIQVRFSPAVASAAVLIASLFIFYYFYTRNVNATPLPTSTDSSAAAPVSTKLPITTQQPVMPTATQSNVDISPTPVAAVYELAFENEKSFIPSQSIAIDNLANLREFSRLGYGKPEEADVAPDNDHIALATSAGVFIFQGNELLKWIDPQGWATSVQFSPDGNTLAIGLMTGEIQLWDWQSETKSPPLEGQWQHVNKINRILFSPGGLLYSASADRHIIVWNLKTNQSILDIPAHSQPVNDIAVTNDGRILVSCSDDQLIRVWDLSTGAKLYELGSASFEGAIRAIAIYTDEAEDISYLAAGGAGGRLYQWKLVTTALSPGTLPLPRNDIVPVQERIWSVEYSPDGNELLVGADNGKSILYDATSRKFEGVNREFEIPKVEKNLLDAFGADFNFSSFSVYRGTNTFSISWDGKVTSQQDQIISPKLDNLDRLDFSRDGTVLAAGGKRGSTQVWDLTTNQTLYQNFYFMPFGEPLAPDGSSIALIVPNTNASRGGDIYQIKNLSGSQTTTDLTETLPNANVGYTKDGNIFIAANLLTSKAWNTSGNEVQVQAIDYFGCRITTSESNNKDRLLVNSATGIFLPEDEVLIDNLCPKTSRFGGVPSAFSQDLTLIAYINTNGALEGYDVLSKTSLWKYQLENSSAVTVIAVSPDGSIVAMGDASGKILFINGKSGELISEIVGNFGKVQAIEFSEDGKKIATAGTDGVVRVFGIVEIK